MSWSVNGKGKPAEAKAQLSEAFKYPLADAPAGLSDDGERETVRLVQGLLNQCLDTFDAGKLVTVEAYGHITVDDWDTKAGRTQSVNITIKPE